MNGLWVTFRKEVFSYFFSPVSWIVAVLFYLWRGLELHTAAFTFAVTRQDPDNLCGATYGFGSTMLMVLLVPGVLSMRCFADEQRTGSIEMLMTAPVRDLEVVVGKWLAAALFYAMLWLPSVLILGALQSDRYLAADLALGPVFSAYLGMFLLSGMLLAFGCFASSLTNNTLLAALVAIIFNMVLMFGPRQLALQLGDSRENYYVRELLAKIDVGTNFRDWFARGLIDTSQVTFYVGGIAFFLGLTWISLVTRRKA